MHNLQPVAAPAPPPPRSELADRFRDPKTLLSFAVLAVLLVVVLTHVRFDYQESLRAMSRTNPGFYALAILVFYFSFVVRAVRWEVLLRNSGEESRFGGLFHIIILAWFANCILPAKMGDFYRAYLLRRRTTISGSHGLGTIVSERIIDFLILVTLLIVTGLISFRLSLPHRYEAAFAAGIGIAAALLVGLIGLRFTGGRISPLLPSPLPGHPRPLTGGPLHPFSGHPPLLVAPTLAP